MATVEDTVSLEELTRQLCQPAELDGRRVRALNPFSLDDAKLLATVQRGEFLLNGFRNRDLRALLFGTAEASSSETRREASAVTRKLRLLRAHGLIRKVPKTHRYMLTPRGQSAIAALSAARQANTAELGQLAA